MILQCYLSHTKKRLPLWTGVWEDLKWSSSELILEVCVGIDTSCHKRMEKQGTSYHTFAKQKGKNIYYFIHVLELSAVMFYTKPFKFLNRKR